MILYTNTGKQTQIDFRLDKNSIGKVVPVSILIPPWILIEVRLNRIKLRNKFTGTYHQFDDGSEEVSLPERLVNSLMSRIGKDLKVIT